MLKFPQSATKEVFLKGHKELENNLDHYELLKGLYLIG